MVWSPIYGNCFDIFAADESFGKSSLTGASYGLSLELQVEEEDYLGGGQTVASGFRVSIQERAGLPLVEEYGVDVNPGSLTSISLQLINITRHEYSNCTSNTWEGAVHGEQLAETSYSYSLTGCQRWLTIFVFVFVFSFVIVFFPLPDCLSKVLRPTCG